MHQSGVDISINSCWVDCRREELSSMTAEGFVHGVTNDFAKEGAEHAHDQRPAMDVQKEELDTQKTPDRDDMKGIMTGVAAVADTRCSDPDPDALSTASNTHLESQNSGSLDVDMAVAYATLNLTDLIGTASARIATCLVCKELFALRMVSKATLKNTNEQIEQLVKRLWFDGPLKQEMDDPGSSRSEGVEVSASEDHSVLNSDIFLNIYDVTKSEGVQWVNGLFANQYSPIKLGGLFHIGVRIDDKEWSYGYTSDGTGVFWTPPFSHAAHHFRESIRMPATRLPKSRIDSVIRQLQAEWTGSTYDLLHRNCCHFADSLCQRLEIGRVPEYTLSALFKIVIVFKAESYVH